MLQWKGSLCPCLENAQDASARQAMTILSSTKDLQWLRKGREKGVGGMVSGWFKSVQAGKAPSADSVGAKLVWVDKDYSNGGPELHIQPQATSTTADGKLQKQTSGYIKTVPLKDMDVVTIVDDATLLLQSDKSVASSSTTNNNNNSAGSNRKDLATLQATTPEQAASVKEALTLMIEWDGRQRAAIPEDERELDDGNEQDGLQRRAQKAAHFAKREIELQQQRRDREKRKAKLVSGAGGLKYTALAMANRMDDE